MLPSSPCVCPTENILRGNRHEHSQVRLTNHLQTRETPMLAPKPTIPEVAPPSDSVVGPSLWDAFDVAQYLKVSRSWVYHQAQAGMLPYRRIGNLLRFEPHAIREYALAGPAPASSTVPTAAATVSRTSKWRTRT
jgi:excisionase family DNA binding protein